MKWNSRERGKGKEYGKTKIKKSNYERRMGKRTNTSDELKEENGEKENRKSNKNNKKKRVEHWSNQIRIK